MLMASTINRFLYPRHPWFNTARAGPRAMPETQTSQAQTHEIKPALTHEDQLILKYLVDQPSISVREVWKRLPKEVRNWLIENGFDDPVYVLDPVDAFIKLVYALAYSEDYDYSLNIVKMDNGDAIIIDVWIPTLGYDTVIIVLPDGDVVAFQYS